MFFHHLLLFLEVAYIYYQDNLIFQIINFPEEILLKDGSKIKLILEEGKLFSTSLKIIENKLHLEIENFKVNDHYFLIAQNNKLYKSLNLVIDENWEKILEYN